MTAQEQASAVTAGAVVLMAAAGFSSAGFPGRMIAVVLSFARPLRQEQGSIAGLCLVWQWR